MEANNVPAPRTPLHLDVTFRRNYARQEMGGCLKNISLSGAFLECRGQIFKPNEKVVLNFVVAGRERKIAAQVVWANSAGCGVKFKPINNRDVQIIDDLIYFVEEARDSRRYVLSDILKKVS